MELASKLGVATSEDERPTKSNVAIALKVVTTPGGLGGGGGGGDATTPGGLGGGGEGGGGGVGGVATSLTSVETAVSAGYKPDNAATMVVPSEPVAAANSKLMRPVGSVMLLSRADREPS